MVQACSRVDVKVPYYNSADLTPQWQETENMHMIGHYSFTDQDGNNITPADFEGRVYVANFFFTTCPGICPKMNANMQRVADSFATDTRVMFLSHSVTPAVDSVPRLKEYADIHHIDSRRWHLVTGNKADIYNLARMSYFAEDAIGLTYDSTDFLHTERFILVDKHRHMRGVYNGTVALEMQRLIDDIRLLLQED